MRAVFFAAGLVLATPLAFAGDDPMAGYVGNTSISIDNNGVTTHVFYRADNLFAAKRASTTGTGAWALQGDKLCLTYDRPAHSNSVCVPVEPHRVGDVWIHGDRHVTLVAGQELNDTPEVLAALAAASRVGNTEVAKDPDGTETRLYWRPDHTFSATRPGWQTEGIWGVKGSSLFLHYNVARPNMGSDEEMKNATPRKVGETWDMADRKATLVAGEQLQQPK